MSFPFSAVVGQDDAKLALLLAAVEPALGGVLLRGEKGSAKTTLARGLAALLPGRAPFVELPLGATEDRVVGSIDVAALLTGEGARFRPGLLADAHGGVLYVDEVNLLADHLVDVLLDVAQSGVNRVERDGVAHTHPARFVLVGSMNPEEGDLRPQLLDRFGLCVTVAAPAAPADRARAVRRRLAHDRSGPADGRAAANDRSAAADRRGVLGTEASGAADAELADRLAGARPAALPDELVELASALAVSVGAEGLRADLGLCRAAAARAAWLGRTMADVDDLRAVAPLVLAHRRRRGPFDEPHVGRDEIDRALDELTGDAEAEPPPALDAETDGPVVQPPTGPATASAPQPPTGPGTATAAQPPTGPAAASAPQPPTGPGTATAPQPPTGPAAASAPQPSTGPGTATAPRPPTHPSPGVAPHLAARRPATAAADGRRSAAQGRGRLVGVERPADGRPVSDVAVTATALAAVERAHGPTANPAAPQSASRVVVSDLRQARRRSKTGNLLIFVVDTSGSMGAARMEAAQEAVLGLLADAYQRRDRVALVSVRGERAEVVLRPTASGEIAQRRLVGLPVGGSTPLADGLATALRLAVAPGGEAVRRPLLVVVTDGRATWAEDGRDPLEAARAVAAEIGRRRIDAVVVDAETDRTRLGLAGELAAAMGADCLALDTLTGGRLERAVRQRVDGGPPCS